MKLSYRKQLCVLLVMCLLISGIPAQADAAPKTEAAAPTAPAITQEEELKTKEEIAAEPLDKGKILQLVDAQAFEANAFTQRVKGEEALNT